MTKKEKELVLIMREVGAYTLYHGDFNMGYSYEFQPDQLERFAELLEAKVRADEREKLLAALEKLRDESHTIHGASDDYKEGRLMGIQLCINELIKGKK
jgi:hypothetical protein